MTPAQIESFAWRGVPLPKVDKPLAGKSVVITRAPEQSRDLAVALEAMGAEVLLLPTVAFAPPADWQELDEQLRKLDGFDAILFLSRNAVRYVFQRCREIGVKCEFPVTRRPFVAAVGPATRDAAIQEGLRVDCVAKGRTAESLVQELRSSVAGRSVFLPRGDRGDRQLSAMLRESGARVTEATAYRTTFPELAPAIVSRIRRSEVDSIVFASPSAFHHLARAISAAELAAISERVHFAAIGPTTARALRDSGVRVAVESAEPSIDALAAAIGKYFTSLVRCA